MKNKAILIVGMHRSGTSALTRVLNLIGADLGPNLMPPAPSNEKGHWEPLDLVEAHEDILKSLDTNWHDIGELTNGWVRGIWESIHVKKIKSFLDQNFASSKIWAVKDPRLCKLLPLWKKLINQLDCEPIYISIVRHPLEVALSLEKRDKMPIRKAGLLWVSHVIGAEEHTRGERRAFLTYQNLLINWRQTIKSIERQTGFMFPSISAETMSKIDTFLEPSLRHHIASALEPTFATDLPAYAMEAYSVLENGVLRQDYDFAGSLESIKKQYISDLNSYPYNELINLQQNVARQQKLIESNFIIRGLSQLFVDSGSGFNEPESVTIHDTIQKSSLVFPLKDFTNIKALRFDPLDGPCVIEIIDAGLITEKGSAIPLSIQTSNAIHKEDHKFFFSTNDPIIILDVDSDDELFSGLEIKLNYLSVGYQALEECVITQEKLISDLRQQIASLNLGVSDRDTQIGLLNEAVFDRDTKIASLNQAVAQRDAQISSLNQAVAQRDAQIAALFQSRSWRLTAPLRFVGRQYKRAKHFVMPSNKVL